MFRREGALPVEFETELNTSGRIGRADCSESVSISQICIGLEEIRMVQRVKHLEAELQSFRFAKIPPFVNAHVPVEIFRGTKILQESRAIAKGVCCRLREGCGIDPVRYALVLRNRAGAGHQIRTLIETKANGIVGRRIDGER